jgi:hypothetical protein
MLHVESPTTVQARDQPLVRAEISALEGHPLTTFDRMTPRGHHWGIRSNADLALFRYLNKFANKPRPLAHEPLELNSGLAIANFPEPLLNNVLGLYG